MHRNYALKHGHFEQRENYYLAKQKSYIFDSQNIDFITLKTTNYLTINIDEIQKKLQASLPGFSAQVELFPSGKRKELSDVMERKGGYRESAVAVVFYKENSILKNILIQRSIYQGVHSNQISFPGGKKEKFDSNLIDTSIRECVEEIGLIKNAFQYLGELSPVYIPVSGFKVQPYLFYYDTLPRFIKNEREVAEIISYPVEQLIADDILKATDIKMYDRSILKNVPYFDIKNKIVWGATAIILNEFRHLLIK